MGLVVRLYDIVSPNKFKLSIGLSPYGNFDQIVGSEANGYFLPSTTGTTNTTHRNYRTDPICITNNDPEITGSTCSVYETLTFDTRYFLKLEDTINIVNPCDTNPCNDSTQKRNIIESIYISDSKTFECYDKIKFDVDHVCITPTPTPQPTATPTPTQSPTPSPTNTPTSTPTPTATNEPTPTATNEPTPTATNEPTPTATNEPTPTGTNEPTPTPTSTKEPTPTPTATSICVEVADFVARSDVMTYFSWIDCDDISQGPMAIPPGDAAPPTNPCIRSGSVTWTPSGGDARVDLAISSSGLCDDSDPVTTQCYNYTLSVPSMGETTSTFTYTTCNGSSGEWTGLSGDYTSVCAQDGTVSVISGPGTYNKGSAC